MTGRYLLDTSVVVDALAGDLAIAAQLEGADELYVSTITLGELHYGAAFSERPEANAARITSFASTCTSIGVDAATAVQFGALKAELRRAGRLIPENDLWIAASAVRHDLVLVARDAHFAAVEGLEREPLSSRRGVGAPPKNRPPTPFDCGDLATWAQLGVADFHGDSRSRVAPLRRDHRPGIGR